MKWLSILNFALLLGAGAVVGRSIWTMTCSSPQTNESHAILPLEIPPGSFELEPGELGKPFALRHTPPVVQLPDLRTELVFYGRSERPDGDARVVHLGFSGSDVVVAVADGERRYIEFDASRTSGPYRFVNEPTKLWVAPRVGEEETLFEVGMRTEEGAEVSEPAQHAKFVLKQTPFKRQQSWQLGTMRVDNSLLARQRTRWFGEDLFLADHGGEEFAYARGRQRIDFGEGKELYSCFLKVGESLVWKGERWEMPTEGETTLGKPLLHLRKCDERLMLFDLWDETGKMKTSLSLMRSKGSWLPQGRQGHLRFVAAKTWSQFILEVGAQRIEVSPGDWLLFNEDGVEKLGLVEEIDAYVAREKSGELMVIDGLARKEGRQTLVAHLYNGNRTEVATQEVPLLSEQGLKRPPIVRKVMEDKDDEDPLMALPRVIRGMIEEINE